MPKHRKSILSLPDPPPKRVAVRGGDLAQEQLQPRQWGGQERTAAVRGTGTLHHHTSHHLPKDEHSTTAEGAKDCLPDDHLHSKAENTRFEVYIKEEMGIKEEVFMENMCESQEENVCEPLEAKDPLGEPEEDHDPLEEPEEAYDPLGEPEEAYDPLGEPEEAHDPLGEPEEAHDPLREQEEAHDPLGGPEEVHDPLGEPEETQDPLAFSSCRDELEERDSAQPLDASHPAPDKSLKQTHKPLPVPPYKRKGKRNVLSPPDTKKSSCTGDDNSGAPASVVYKEGQDVRHLDQNLVSNISNILPANFSHKVIRYNGTVTSKLPAFHLVVDSTVHLTENVYDWIREFSENTCTIWSQKSTVLVHTQNTAHRRIQFICKGSRTIQHKKSREKYCSATIDFLLYYKDMYPIVSQGYFSRVNLKFIHTHHFQFEEAQQNRNLKREVKDAFKEYFNEGHSPTSAHYLHEARLWFRDAARDLLADSTFNPTLRTIHYMRMLWVRNSEHVFNEINLAKDNRELFKAAIDKATKLCIQKVGLCTFFDNPLSIVLTTPIMQRLNEMPEAGLVVFVNTIPECGPEKFSVTFFTCTSDVGVLPLAAIIVMDSSISTFKIVFRKAFGQKGLPLIVISDGFEPQMEALKMCFPLSQVFLCVTHLAQSVWQWLSEASNNIQDQDRVTLMHLVKNILYAPTAEISSLAYRMLLAHNTAKKYAVFNTYMATLWNRRGRVGFMYRLPLSEKTFIDMSSRIFVDVVLKCQAFGLLTVLDYIYLVLEEGFQSRISEFIENTASQSTFLGCLESSVMPEIRKVGNSYTVRSREREEWFTVHPEPAICSCPSGSMGGFCDHLRAVWKKCNLQLPPLPVTDAAGKVRLASIAYGKGGYQTYNKAEYEATMKAFKENLFRLESLASQNIANSFISKMKRLNERLDSITSLGELGEFCDLAAGVQANDHANTSGMQPKPKADAHCTEANVGQSQPNVVQQPKANVGFAQARMGQQQPDFFQPVLQQPKTNVCFSETNLGQPQSNLVQSQANLTQIQAPLVSPQSTVITSPASILNCHTNGVNPVQILLLQPINNC